MLFKPVNNTTSGIEKGDFYCYEVKSSVEDFRSKNGHNFLGDFNYYVMPEEVLEEITLKVSQFLPVYWYENVNETLGSYSHLTGEAAVSVWKGIGLEVMFAVVFVCMILAVTRYQRQK